MKLFNNIKGNVFEMQRWSLNDGEGIRTTVFLQGCPLRCRWCHNPESWKETDGKEMSVKDIIDVIQKDMIFYRESGGGVTFSGGEPTLQHEFLTEIVKGCTFLGIETAIETCGYFQWEQTKDIIDGIDFVFVDIKHMDSDMHKKYTGVSNEIILENIIKISALNKKPVIRIPLIEDINDDLKNITATLRFISQNLTVKGVEILPYHNYGTSKYKSLGIGGPIDHFKTPSKEKIDEIKGLIKQYGLVVADYK